MSVLFLLFTFMTATSYAGFEKLTIQNLDFDYKIPMGKGTVEKVNIGVSLSLTSAPYEVEVHRTDSTFNIISPLVDLEWDRPHLFFHDMQKLNAKKLNLKIGYSEHTATADSLMAGPHNSGDYLFEEIVVKCKGISISTELENRLYDDCRENLNLTAKKVDVPVDFFLLKILSGLPKMPSESDIPAHDLSLTSKDGNFALFFYFRYYVYARLRAWGSVAYENNYKTIVVKIDQIKFGYIPVTSFVMSRLQETLKHPSVKVDPPYIRIDTSKL